MVGLGSFIMGERVVYVGGAGTDQVVKACSRIVVALVIETVSEGLVLGSKAEVEAEKVIEVGLERASRHRRS